MMVTTKLNLSMTEPQVRQIYAKQGDTGRVLDITLDQTPEDGTLRILRPDGVEVTSEAVTGGEISESGETATFESLTEADVTELTVGIEPVQDLSHGDPSPSNICPISGWDSVDLWNDPKYGGTIKWNQLMQNGNFADGSSGWSGGSASLTVSNGIARATLTGVTWNNEVRNNSAIVVDSHIYLCSALVRLSSANFHVTFRNTGGQLSLNNNFNSTAWSKYESLIKVTSHSQDGFAVTVRENGSALAGEWFEAQNFNAFDLTAMFGSTVAEYIYSLEQATTGAGVAYFRNLFPQDYYPYDDSYTETCVSAVNGDAYLRYQIQLGQTVYGGTLDMVSGVLTVTHGNIASYNGETLPSTWISDRDVYASGTTPTTGAQVVYELATPLTYQLTSQQMKTLAGTNNVWASSGDIVNITFTYGGLLSELPSDATSIVGKCYCDVEQNGVSSMPFTLNVKKNERES